MNPILSFRGARGDVTRLPYFVGQATSATYNPRWLNLCEQINNMASSSAVFVIVVCDIPVKGQGEWLRMAEELTAHTWAEPGCNSYSFIKKAADVVPAPPAGDNGAAVTRFVISEIWASQAQLEAHFQTPHFQKLVRLKFQTLTYLTCWCLCRLRAITQTLQP